MNRRVGWWLLAAAWLLAIVVPLTLAGEGNGVPSGAHYNLNIIGVSHDKTADMTGSDGHVIFVPLDGDTKILLSEGDFQVLDANGTQGPAKFQLPNPDPDNDGWTVYSVYARPLGKPGGQAEMFPTALAPIYDEFGNVVGYEEVVSLASYVAVRGKGGSKFENVSAELLYIWADLNDDGVVEQIPLFDERLTDYMWEYQNDGLKHLQLRFYEVPTDVTGFDPLQ